jgi:hypothetical protein
MITADALLALITAAIPAVSGAGALVLKWHSDRMARHSAEITRLLSALQADVAEIKKVVFPDRVTEP